MNVAARCQKPDHVPQELVFEFDMYDVPGGGTDAQAAYYALQQSHPDIFWTPMNGGHWVFTRADDVEGILRNTQVFSSTRILIPRDDSAPRLVPIEIDPPRHTQLRKPLTLGLVPKVIDAMEESVRDLTTSLIDGLKSKGGCEFVADFAQILPMCIFLDLVDLPREERLRLHPLVERFVKGGSQEIRGEAQGEVFQYIQNTVRARRANPGTDLASKIVNCEVDGAMIDEDEASAYIVMLMFAGLDTVASMLSYIMNFLANNEVQRHQLIDRLDDDDFLRNAIEELFRRHGIIVTGRTVSQDILFRDVQILANDTILPIHMLCGLDDRRISDPLTVDFNRPVAGRHSIFGTGPHTCPGAMLARREVKVFLREWLKRIPDFTILPGSEVRNVLGLTCSLDALHLVW